MQIARGLGISAASAASGAVVVIDTFRAFTTAAVLLGRDAPRVMLAADLDEARAIAREHGALLCGEDRGRKPEDFDLGNSPADAETDPAVSTRAVVMRTTAGTRSVLAALDAGAAPVFAASLVVASATARAMRSQEHLTIVSAGLHGTDPAVEDDLTGDLIADLVTGSGDPAAAATRVAESERAELLRSAPWAGPRDVEIASDVDRFDFAMQAHRSRDGLVVLTRFGAAGPR